MKIKEKLTELANYYSINRQVGHTSIMLNGTNSCENSAIVVHNHDFGTHLKKQCNKTTQIISVNSLDKQLRGLSKPLVIDNATLFSLFSEASEKISELELKLQSNQNCVFK